MARIRIGCEEDDGVVSHQWQRTRLAERNVSADMDLALLLLLLLLLPSSSHPPYHLVPQTPFSLSPVISLRCFSLDPKVHECITKSTNQ